MYQSGAEDWWYKVMTTLQERADVNERIDAQAGDLTASDFS